METTLISYTYFDLGSVKIFFGRSCSFGFSHLMNNPNLFTIPDGVTCY